MSPRRATKIAVCQLLAAFYFRRAEGIRRRFYLANPSRTFMGSVRWELKQCWTMDMEHAASWAETARLLAGTDA